MGPSKGSPIGDLLQDRLLVLSSPYGSDEAVYRWPLQQADKHSKHDGSIEIVETIRWVFEDLPELREAIREELSEFTISGDMKNYDSMRNLCEKYNTALQDILKIKPLKANPLKRPNVGLLKHIIQKSYNHAVTDPEKLNEYPPWTPEVYGETSFEFVSQMLESVNIDEEDVFIDLGSGVGQVVLQVAASVQLKKCIGIERAEVPVSYSKELDRQFRFWMSWFGKSYSDYELIKGDFFEPQFRDTISNASFIFCNNYAFGPKVDHQLKKMFEELKDGARIFSSKAFSPVNFRITDRNLNDIGTIMHVRELQPTEKGSVSWTDNSVSYYCHTIDRTKLEDYYFSKMKGGGHKKEVEKRGRGRPPRSDTSSGNDSYNESSPLSSSNSTNQSNGKTSKNEDEVIVYGPTTRTAWKEYCQSLSKPEKASATSSATEADPEKRNKKMEARKKEVEKLKPRPKLLRKASSSNDDESIENRRQDVKPRGRPRKYPPGVTAVINRAVKKNTKVAGVNEPRRPGRPPKDPKKRRDINPLETLHQQTLLSVQSQPGKRLSPAPGCVDRKLSESSTEETGVPPVIVKDSSIQAVNEELDDLMASWKQQMLSFLTYMQMPDFKASLVKQIEDEKKRKQVLLTQVESMDKAVKNLQERGVLALNVKLAELGIQASSADHVLDKAREIIALNKALSEKELQIQAEVSREEAINQEIVRFVEKKNALQPQDQNRNRALNGVDTGRSNSVAQSPGRVGKTSVATCRPTSNNSRQEPLVHPSNDSASKPSDVSVFPTPAAPVTSKRGSASAAKEQKGKKEPKKRTKKSATSDSSTSSSTIDDIIANVSSAKTTCDDDLDAKGNDKDATSQPKTCVGQGDESTDKDKRLTLTLVINRVNNSASVKSPSRTPPDKSPFGSKNSPKSPHENKRKQRSTDRDTKSKKTRSSKSSGPDTSSESETKIKIKLGSNKEPMSVEPVLPTPTLPEKEKTSTPVSSAAPVSTAPTTTTGTAGGKTCSGTKKWHKATLDSNFDKLLAVANHEMNSLQNAQEAQANSASASTSILPENNRVAPSPMSSSSRPSSTSSSFTTNTSLPQHPTLAELAFNRRAACVNTPPQTPSPSFSADRPVTPGNSTSSSSLSPSLHHHPGHQGINGPSTSSASSLSHDSEGAFNPSYINSIQSIKNLASLSSYASQQRTSTSIEAPKGRKPGRPPKKSISNDLWTAQLEAAKAAETGQLHSSLTSSHGGHVSNQCQYPNGDVPSDYSQKSKQTSSSSNYYNGITCNPAMSMNHASPAHSLASPSVIQSTGHKTSSGRSSSGPSHLMPENLTNFYLPNNPYSSQGPSSTASSYTSVIRRHDASAGPAAYVPFPGFSMIPGYPMSANMQQYQKEFERSYLSFCQNGLAGEFAAAAAAQKMMRPSSTSSSGSSLQKRGDFNPSSYQTKQMSSLMNGEGPGK